MMNYELGMRSNETEACEMLHVGRAQKREKVYWPNEPTASQVKEYVDEREGVAADGVRVAVEVRRSSQRFG